MISRPVPPKKLATRYGILSQPDMILGNTATKAKNSAPGSVMRVMIKSKYSAVCFPGLIPGMNPPYFFILSAMSTGLNVIAV